MLTKQETNNMVDVKSLQNTSSVRPLKIAYCLPTLETPETGGAYVIQQKLIAAGLQSRGHLLTFVGPHNLVDTVCTKDLNHLTLAPRTWSKTSWFTVLRKLIWRVQQGIGIPYLNMFSNYSLYDAGLQCLPGHDLVQERNGLYRAGVAMACKRLKLPYLLFFDADDILERDFVGDPITGILRWRAKQIIRYTLKAADGVICVSNATQKRLIDVWGVPEEKIAVFPNGVDVQHYQPYPEERAKVRASLGIGDNPLVIFVGSFYPWHDVTTLLESFPQVLAAYPEARLLLVGEGKDRPAMMQRATHLGIDHAVQFTGQVPHAQVPYLVSAADVAVAPIPKMEQDLWLSPMKLFEYMAAGTPVVASQLGQVGEVVQDEVNGLSVPSGDVSALANALNRLIENPDLRLRLSRQAREDAVQKYSWRCYLSRLEQVYETVIKHQPIHKI